jgi:hypothetical protein
MEAAKSGWQASNKRDKSDEMASDHRLSRAGMRAFRGRSRSAALAADEHIFHNLETCNSQEKASLQARAYPESAHG